MQGKTNHSQQTEMNLLQAFAGESQANRKYLLFAKQAEKEGYPQVAKLFRAAAEAETVHAHAHLRTLGIMGNTMENLKAAIAGETYEFTEMYPGMIQTAKQEDNQAAHRTFSYANAVELVHAELYRKALDNLGSTERPTITYAPFAVTPAKRRPPARAPFAGPRPRLLAGSNRWRP